MASDWHETILIQKQRLRRELRGRRASFAFRDAASQAIASRLLGLPEVVRSRVIMTYVSVGSEVATRDLVPKLFQLEKIVLVPYCLGSELQLFQLEALDELEPGTLGIPEPPPRLRSAPQRQGQPETIDVALVPGLAFDLQGNRLGQGKGYYDRFLRTMRPDAFKLGLAFECQLVPAVPHTHHDTPVDAVLTEKTLYRFR